MHHVQVHLLTYLVIVHCVVGDEVSRKEEIEKFLEDNKHLLSNQMKDVQVTTMRHILPLLLMETYSDHYQPYVRKGKQLFN